ncbi:universal stress protein [Streptomyces sp. NPDC059166]|uniref:universal stress protein n=1 Tax=Streptomyces sp. NPDC059166 TaxID=3346752 RepID=UPI00367B5A17
MSADDLPVIAAVDGSTHGWEALGWAAAEALRRDRPLVVVHVRPYTGRTDAESDVREAGELLDRAVARTSRSAPGLRVSTLAPLDFPSAALVSLSRDASMVVMGSRGLGGFRALMIGSNSLATASMAQCPVVVVRTGRTDGSEETSADFVADGREETSADVVAGVAADESSGAVLDFAFEAAAARPGARLRVVHGWTMFSSLLAGGPVFDSEAASASADLALAELTAGRSESHPEVRVVREPVRGSASRTLVAASATAALTVVGRRKGGESLGLGLSPVAQTTVTHSLGPVAVVPA